MPASDSPPAQFPSPQVFSLLPPIHALLQRLQTSNPPLDSSASLGDGSEPHASQPLRLKDLPSAAAPIKLKITKAKAIVEGLPDIDRTIEEQEVEIRELDERVRKLKGFLGRVGDSR